MKVTLKYIILGVSTFVGIFMLILAYMYAYWTLPVPALKSSGRDSIGGDEGLTIRVNTFKRLDLLEVFHNVCCEKCVGHPCRLPQ